MDAIYNQYTTTTIARDMLGATSEAMMSRAFFNPSADLAQSSVFYPVGAAGASKDEIIERESQMRMHLGRRNPQMLQLGQRRAQGAQAATSGVTRAIEPVYNFK